MLTRAQIDYLRRLDIGIRVRAGKNGREVVGGDDAYSDALNDAGALARYCDLVKVELNAEIDETIERVAPRSVSPRYLAKQFGAQLFKARGYRGAADYRYLTREAAERGITNQEMADAIIAASAPEMDKAARIEARRAKLNDRLDSASDIEAVFALLEQAQKDIEAIE